MFLHILILVWIMLMWIAYGTGEDAMFYASMVIANIYIAAANLKN